MGARWCLKLAEGKSIPAGASPPHRNKSPQGLVTSPALPKAAPALAGPGPALAAHSWEGSSAQGSAAHHTCGSCPHGLLNPALVFSPRPLVQVWGSSP